MEGDGHNVIFTEEGKLLIEIFLEAPIELLNNILEYRAPGS